MHDKLIKCLMQVASGWLDRGNHLRQEASAVAAPEFCLSPASFEWAVDWIFSQWTEDNIKKILAQHPFKKCRYAVQILAGNTPAMIAQGFLQGALLNIPQCIKVPSQQTAFARLLQQSFAESSTELVQLFEVASWQDKLPQFYAKLSQADLVLAYGQDETIAVLKDYIGPDAIYLAHGHAESAAIITKEAAEVKYLENLADDMLSYDQRGCLSPRVTFIEQGGTLSPADCTRVFADEILPAAARRLPRGGLFPGEAAEILHQRIVCGFRGSVYCGEDWTVSYAEDQPWSQEALPRFMLFTSFANTQALIKILYPFKERLMCLGFAGPKTKLELLNQALDKKMYPLGEMQKQLLLW